MKEIPLTQGFVAIVDDGDYGHLARFKWCVRLGTRGGRRLADAMRLDGKRHIAMHREIMSAPAGILVDHIRQCDLAAKIIDNRRENLRLATYTQNQANSRKLAAASSIFKGARWYKRKRKWAAAIQSQKAREHLGYFDVEAYAALAYDLAAVRLFGAFALTNFPVPGSTNWIYGPLLPEERAGERSGKKAAT